MVANKIELLAPAGDPEGLRAAICAGADAVYIGGEKFGARAYANNFTKEDILDALFYAHLRSKKVYLTVNTLMKNSEIAELYEYLYPLVAAGLDAVIVQDFGAVDVIHEYFPDLEIHASTQMTITTSVAAKYLKSKGICRVVLARELTAKEIKRITDCGIEVEAFIHGSMCYCYSGQCLFSSMLGERSGNRGRCAQPCRLPYGFDTNTEKNYILSMKDMCTIENMDEILSTGVVSLKIEGRMKSSQYTAGVTSLYRKYIDLFLADKGKKATVSKEDMSILRQLYVRTQLQNGYYFKTKGKDMITFDSPAYAASSKEVLTKINEQYVIANNDNLPVNCKIYMKPSEKMKMEVFFTMNSETFVHTCFGAEVQTAQNRPLTEEDVRKQLQKTGGTGFRINQLMIFIENNCFVPVKQLNDLRREAMDGLSRILQNDFKKETEENMRHLQATYELLLCSHDVAISCHNTITSVFVRTYEQLTQLQYFDSFQETVLDYALCDTTEKIEFLKKNYPNLIFNISLPLVMREEEFDDNFKENIRQFGFLGIKKIYCNQADQVCELIAIGFKGKIIGNYALYCMNNNVSDFWGQAVDGYTVSPELTKNDIKNLQVPGKEMIIYGAVPLMETANCVALSSGKCRKATGSEEIHTLTDRQNTKFPVILNCRKKYCTNTIYNSVPTSLHKHYEELKDCKASVYQIRFTIENAQECNRILNLYSKLAKESQVDFPDFNYTNGHFLRPVQ